MNPSKLALPVLLATLLWGADGAPARAQAAPQLDSIRLLLDLSVLAHDSMAGRATGSPGAQRTRAFLATALEEANIRPAYPRMGYPFRWARGMGENIVGIIPGRGTADDLVVVLTAHYDHLGLRDGQVFNGADDNASGVAALLEIGRQLASAPLDHTTILAFVDAEEVGFQGSRAFVDDPPVPFDRIALNVNLDMVARTDGVLWAGGAYHTPALRPILEALAAEAPLTLKLGHDRWGAPEGDDWTNSSDHAPFHEVGVPYVYFGVEDHADYHEPSDDFERVDLGEFTASVRTILMGIRVLDRALPLPGRAGR
ncbi:MAG: M28 family peptidase [Gemmatimonadota bacterium]|nr:M28 family peptidase [Gemmatimonadota bacterium]